jgi:peptide/nickel transport system substrate-binding protein
VISFHIFVENNIHILEKIRAHRAQFYSFREKILLAVRSFSKKEKLLFGFFVIVVISSGLGIISHINRSYMLDIPAYGGSFIEGVDGTTPRFINPILSLSDSTSEKDLTKLVYSGLMRIGKQDNLIPDMAEKYTISEDNKTYTFTLKNNLTWSDGKPITADDVVFTIKTIQDPAIRSPQKNAWEGVVVEKVDIKTVKFTLTQPYALFLENTTLGIIPKHIWGVLTPEQFFYSSYNAKPVGSGPFKITNIQQNASGIPESYTLVPFDDFVLGKPYLNSITFKFYPNYEKLIAGYQAGEFSSVAAISPESAVALKKNNVQIVSTPLPRIFSVFFNQNQQGLFIDKAVRQSLDLATDKDQIIKDVFFGYATKIDGPLPPNTLGFQKEDAEEISITARLEQAQEILAKNGWTINKDTGVMEKIVKKKPTEILEFSLSVSSNPEMKKVAEILKENWQKIGAKVTIKTYEEGDLLQAVIRPRKYDALLSGEIIGQNPDLYAYWHSSQRLDPGLNMSIYASVETDKLLEQARTESSESKRIEIYAKFLDIIHKDTPAIFLYSPNFIYVLPKDIHGINLSGISILSDRFANAYEWYSKTQKVWPFFAGK